MGERNRINGFHAWGLLVAATLADTSQFILGFIPFGGALAGALARLTFWVWFKVLGVGFADKSDRFVVNILMTVTELTPLLNLLPTWTLGTILIIRQVRKEDEDVNRKQQKGAQEEPPATYRNGTPKPQRPNQRVVNRRPV